MTIAEFERQYRDVKPNHEYWFGEAVPKAGATSTHGLLQNIVTMTLDEAGYKAAPEVTLKISSDFQPVPDVIATAGRFERPYPTKPVDVVVEILSPEDSLQRVLRKCKLYSAWGIPLVVVLDPDGREGWIWEDHTLRPTTAIVLENGRSISLDRIFRELDAELQ